MYPDEFDDENYVDLDDDEELDQCPEGLIASSGKLKVIKRLVTQWRKEGHKFIIFSQFVKSLEIIEA